MIGQGRPAFVPAANLYKHTQTRTNPPPLLPSPPRHRLHLPQPHAPTPPMQFAHSVLHERLPPFPAPAPPPTDAVTLFFCSPVLAALLELAVTGESHGWAGAAATTCTVCGVVLVSQPECLFRRGGHSMEVGMGRGSVGRGGVGWGGVGWGGVGVAVHVENGAGGGGGRGNQQLQKDLLAGG